MNAVRVETVKTKPDLPFLVPVYGLTSAGAARAWGEKNQMSVVYFIESKQRAYGLRGGKIDNPKENSEVKE